MEVARPKAGDAGLEGAAAPETVPARSVQPREHFRGDDIVIPFWLVLALLVRRVYQEPDHRILAWPPQYRWYDRLVHRLFFEV
jgi:hypothetical protein